MNEKHNKNPGDDDLKKFQLPGLQGPNANPKYHEDSLVTKKKGGGGGGGDAAKQAAEDREQAKPLEPASGEPYDFPTQEVAKPEEKAKGDSAVISDAKWHADDTLFQEEAEASVHLVLPPGKEHLTKVQAELFAKTPKGPESISKAEGHAQADGRATVTLPVYKPKGHGSDAGHDGGPVEYFIEFTHKLAEMFIPENILRKVTETALKAADHELVPGVSFAKDTSFIQPTATKDFKQLESTVKEWDQKYPKKAYISVFGHVDADEKDPKGLSERRAQSAFAFITNDVDTWDKLYSAEKWGLKALQVILKDLGHYHDTPNGQDGPNTHAAFKAIQKSAGLPQSGREDSATRKAIFSAYMKGKHDIKIDAARFKDVAGHPWMGCAAHNRAKDGEDHAPENRRVTFMLLKDSKYFPVHFPCQDGNEAPCQTQCKKAGKRSGPGIKCLFYDELVREKPQAATNEQDKAETHSSFVKFSNTLDLERQKVLSGKSIEIIGKAAKAAGLEAVTITSTIRYPHQQADAMYTNLSNGKRLSYAAPGEAVTDVYDKCHKEGLDKAVTIEKMVEKINALSNEGKRVSKHCVSTEEYGRLNIVDIGIPLKNVPEFIIEIAKDDGVEKIFHDIKTIPDSGKIARLAKEPCIHVEIKQ